MGLYRSARRSALEIKKEIIKQLRNKAMTPRRLQEKVNTDGKTINRQLKELEYFGIVVIKKHKRHKRTGRPYSMVKLQTGSK